MRPPLRATLTMTLVLALSGLSAIAAEADASVAGPGPRGPAATSTAATPATATTQLPPYSARTWGTNGRVRKVLSVGGRVVVAGDFSAVVSPAGRTVPVGNLGVFDPATGTFDLRFSAATDGTVNTMASDGTTLYLGGDFLTVNGQPRARLAAVSLATGALTTWAPRADGSVFGLAVAGRSVVVGGAFGSVASTTAAASSGPYLARVTTGGEVSATPIPTPDATVRSFVTSPDQATIYVGGDFATLDGNTLAARRSAKVDVATGALDGAFRSGLTNGPTRGPVAAMALGGGQLYLAVGGAGGACAGLDPTTGQTRWSKHGNGDMQGVEFIDGITFCGGHFGGSGSFDGLDRQKIAAVDPLTATTIDWQPRVSSPLGVWCMDTDGQSLYVGGDFESFGTTSGVGRLASVIPPAAQRPAGPVVSLQGYAYDHSVELAWDAPSTDGGSPVRWYVVTRHEGTQTTIVGRRVKTQTFVDRSGLNGHTYTYDVAAVSALGTAPVVTTGLLTPASYAASPPTAPQEPLALAGELGVDLSWTPPVTTGGAPLTAYVLYRSVSGAAPVPLTTLAPTAGTYRDVSVTTAHTYRYEIAARNAAGESPPATTATVTPLPSRPPTPTLTVTSGPGVAATLSWTLGANTSGSPITKFVVIRDAVRFATPQATSQSGGSLLDTMVVRGQTYTYQVRALSAGGTSGGSTKVSITIP
ncbi:fibronectin type III domain-containing protein [Dermatophilaceae bacterium Soc4.6]